MAIFRIKGNRGVEWTGCPILGWQLVLRLLRLRLLMLLLLLLLMLLLLLRLVFLMLQLVVGVNRKSIAVQMEGMMYAARVCQVEKLCASASHLYRICGKIFWMYCILDTGYWILDTGHCAATLLAGDVIGICGRVASERPPHTFRDCGPLFTHSRSRPQWLTAPADGRFDDWLPAMPPLRNRPDHCCPQSGSPINPGCICSSCFWNTRCGCSNVWKCGSMLMNPH